MLVSELVKQLTELQSAHGDIRVVVNITTGDIECPRPDVNTDEAGKNIILMYAS